MAKAASGRGARTCWAWSWCSATARCCTPAASGQARRAAYYGLGTGPDAPDLFLQSSLGIATAGAFAFIPRPERIDYAFASFQRGGLAEVVDTVLALRRERVLDTTFRLSELPVEPGRTGPAPDFTLLGPLLGRRAAVEATEAVLREELGRLPSFRSFECGPVAEMALTHPLYLRTQFFRGIPSCDMMRARFRVDSCDLDGRSESGWTVVATVLPLQGRAVQTALDVVTRVVDVEGLTCRLEVSTVSATTILLMTAIWFPRDADGIARMRRTQRRCARSCAPRASTRHATASTRCATRARPAARWRASRRRSTPPASCRPGAMSDGRLAAEVFRL